MDLAKMAALLLRLSTAGVLNQLQRMRHHEDDQAIAERVKRCLLLLHLLATLITTASPSMTAYSPACIAVLQELRELDLDVADVGDAPSEAAMVEVELSERRGVDAVPARRAQPARLPVAGPRALCRPRPWTSPTSARAVRTRTRTTTRTTRTRRTTTSSTTTPTSSPSLARAHHRLPSAQQPSEEKAQPPSLHPDALAGRADRQPVTRSGRCPRAMTASCFSSATRTPARSTR